MAGKALLAVQYERQYAEAIDKDYKFTTVERMDYLTNPLRYEGQIVFDSDEDALYCLNSARDAWLVLGSATEISNTDDVPEGGVNKYFTEARVRATILTGLSLATSAAITAADSVLGAFGKLQAQITTLLGRIQNSLTYDGTGTKIPTVDSVNSSFLRNTKLFARTGIAHKNDTFELTVLDANTVRILACETVVFWNKLFDSGITTEDAVKSFPQKDYPLSQLITATGGNINLNPLTTDGTYVRYIAYDISGNVVSSASNFIASTTYAQLGFVTVIKSGSTVTFLGGTTPGARNVFSQPLLANITELDRTIVSNTSDVVIGFNTGTPSLNSSNGSITGLSINWKGLNNPGNSAPIDKLTYTGLATLPFVSINPSFLTQTTAPTSHTLWTETEGGIQINRSIWNTTTGLRATLDNNKFSVKRVLIGVRGGIFLQDGEHAGTAGYATINDAIAAISSHAFTESIIPPGVVIEVARIAFKYNVTNFADSTQFYITSTFNGASGGSGGSSSDFASISGDPYDNVLLAEDLNGKANKNLTLSYQIAPYTLTLTDSGAFVQVDSLTANTLTIPPNSSVAFPIGTQIVGTQFNSGQITITPGSGVTINAEGGKMKTIGQYSGFTLIKTATNTWFLFGGLTA